jgi:lycopene beta-cyclase
MKRYDFIILGAGASGLSLACHLAASPLRDRSILLVDSSLHEHSRRTWAFWERAGSPMPFGGLAFHSWRRLLVATPGRTLALRSHPYIYKAIRSADFYHYAHKRLSPFSNIEFMEGKVGIVEETDDGEDGARIRVGREWCQGQWVFDSRFNLGDFDIPPRPHPRYHYLRMQILGWEIETDHPSFDPQIATFLDFRTPQESGDPGGGARFLYVLPSHRRHALVEHVACIPAHRQLMHKQQQEEALTSYIERTLGVRGYTVTAQEQGVNPMTNYPFPRRTARHVMTIGITGGMLKPSTGFAFARIQRDSAAIVRSLLDHDHPFDMPRTEWPYRLFEPVMLWAMARNGEKVGSLLGTLFRVGRTHKILSFLDEKGMPV